MLEKVLNTPVFRLPLVMFCIIVRNIWCNISNSYMVLNNLPFLEYFRKVGLTTSLRKARRSRDSSLSSLLIRYTTLAAWRTTSTVETNEGLLKFFLFGYQSATLPRSGPCCWQNPCSGCNRRINLVVVREYTFFQTLFQHQKHWKTLENTVSYVDYLIGEKNPGESD